MAKSIKVEFAGAQGDRIAARLELPVGTPRAYAIFAHCFSCSKDIFAASRVSRRLAQMGLAVLRFDFTGLGQSDGDFANTNFSSNIADLVKAGEFLSAEYKAPALLVGHSLGGAAVIAAALEMPTVKAVATIGAPADAEHVQCQFAEQIETIRTEGVAEVSLAGRPFTVKKQFLDDIAGRQLETAAAALKRPLLITHSPIDAIVGVDNATRLFSAAKHPKSYLSLDGADHLLSQEQDALHAADVIAAWAQRYVFDDVMSAPPKPDRKGGVVVAETGAGKFQNHVVIGPHHMLADEPESFGGDESGPTPYQYLNAALGSCTSMTIRMYAQRKKWPLRRVSVTLNHEKGHAEDCANCVDGQEKRIDIIERSVELVGELDAAQRKRLLEIADMCPVHRTLNSPVVIRTREAGRDS
ncbi:MAG: bifunctional alpha/beta hydrolase/OsmC family protein [Maricaulis sp.]|jgi:putative redox protein|nr:bifunctional alpha/beta hydrolase/OsmC family protein [Maricaulis sp.]MDG2045078.1 bifunctional alpha/beta hydrolase/OsmC family protein [Maricaulis sp.]